VASSISTWVSLRSSFRRSGRCGLEVAGGAVAARLLPWRLHEVFDAIDEALDIFVVNHLSDCRRWWRLMTVRAASFNRLEARFGWPAVQRSRISPPNRGMVVRDPGSKPGAIRTRAV